MNQTLTALFAGKSILLSGSDNTGKSTIVNLLAVANVAEKRLHLDRLRLCQYGFISRGDALLRRSLRGLQRRIRSEFGAAPEVTLGTLSQTASFVRERSGLPLCLVVDDLYRFEEQWDLYPHAAQVLDTIGSAQGIQWVVCDNNRCDDIRDRLADNFERVDVGFFTEEECREFFHRHFPELEGEEAGISGPVFDATRGCPYLVLTVADRLAESGVRTVSELPVVMERIVAGQDKTVQKVLEYADWRPRLLDLLRRMYEDSTDPTARVDADTDEASLAHRLVSTSAFILRPSDGTQLIGPSAPIFRDKVARALDFVDNVGEAADVYEASADDLPEVLRRKRRGGFNQGLLAHYACRRIADLAEKDAIRALLDCFLALFDFKRFSLFMVSERPHKRIVLAAVAGKDAQEIRRAADDLGWAEGLGQNQWLDRLLHLSVPVFFAAPFHSPAREIVGDSASLTMDEAWRDACEGSGVVAAMPFSVDPQDPVGVLVADRGGQAIDHRQVWRMSRCCDQLAATLWAAQENVLLRQAREQHHRAMRLTATCANAASASNQLHALCHELRRALQADYVDVVEISLGGELVLTARSSSPGISDSLSAYTEGIVCAFRSEAAQALRGTRRTSNVRNRMPSVPGSDQQPEFRTAVGRPCGASFMLGDDGFEQLASQDRVPEPALKKLRPMRDHRFGTREELDARLGALVTAEELAEHGEAIAKRAARNPVGVLTVAFGRKRLLSFWDLKLIDASAELAANFVKGLRERKEVAELHQEAIRAFANVPLSVGLQQFVRVVADYMGVKYCSVSLVRDDRIQSLASIGYREGYDAASYPLDEGRTGLVVTYDMVFRQAFGKATGQNKCFFYQPGEGFKAVPEMTVAPFLNTSRCLSFRQQGDRPDMFLGIPMDYHDEEDGKTKPIGCIKALHLPEDPEITEHKIVACLDVAQAVALTVVLAREREQRERERIEIETLRVTLDQQNRQFRQLSHDFNTPVASIDGIIFNLETVIHAGQPLLLTREAGKAAKEIRKQLSHLNRLAEFSREMRKTKAEPEAIDLSEWLPQYVIGRARHYSLQADLRCGQLSQGARIRFDPHHLERILDNLVRNAQEAGARRVVVDAERNHTWVAVRVRDDGHGFRAKDLAKIWSPFHSSKPDPEAGQGLATVRVLVEANMASCIAPTRTDEGWTAIGLRTRTTKE